MVITAELWNSKQPETWDYYWLIVQYMKMLTEQTFLNPSTENTRKSMQMSANAVTRFNTKFNVQFFATAADLWSSHTSEPYLSLTNHFIHNLSVILFSVTLSLISDDM